MRKLLSVVVAAMLIATCLPMIVDAGSDQVEVYVNGRKVGGAETPIILGKQAYIGIQTLADMLDAKLSWNTDRTQATLSNSDLDMTIGEAAVTINGRSIDLHDDPPIAYNNTMMVPLQYKGSALGIKYVWDRLTHSLLLYKKDNAELDSHWQEQTEVLDPTEKQSSPAEFVRLDGDKVVIQTKQSVRPTHFYLNEGAPYRIVLDYPISAFFPEGRQADAQLNGELVVNGPLIEKVRYAAHTKELIRFVVELKRDAQYTITHSTDGLITNVTTNIVHKVYRIVIDPGHGGKDPGASGASGRYEKHFNLELSKKVADRLMKESDFQAYLTRWDDTFIELEDRAAVANRIDADLFISIHGNTFTKPISGTETYYFGGPSLHFAQVMHQHVLAATKMPDRKVREENFKVLRLTQMPAVLLEIGYLSNESDESLMLTSEFQDKVADSIVAAIKEYLHL